MLLKSTRALGEMSPVLLDGITTKDPSVPVYWVFSGVSKIWENMTIVSPGNHIGEFHKTFGHYHSSGTIEKYKLLTGKGILILQKRKFSDDDWVPDKIEKIYFVEFMPGDEVDITPEWGHSWSNIGNEPLITLDNWKDGHTPQDYEPIEKMKGMGYYLVSKNGSAEFISNKNYRELPKPEWITAEDFNKINNGY